MYLTQTTAIYGYEWANYNLYSFFIYKNKDKFDKDWILIKEIKDVSISE